MPSGKVSIDGRLVDVDEARVPVLDRGFLYGDSVFEVFRTYGGVPFAETEHLERLARSAERLMIPMPVSIETLSSEVRATLDAAGRADWIGSLEDTRRPRTPNYDPYPSWEHLRVIIAEAM